MATSQEITDLKALINELTDKLSGKADSLNNISEQRIKSLSEEANKIRENLALLGEAEKLEKAIFNDYQSRGLLLDNEIEREKKLVSLEQDKARLAFKALLDLKESGNLSEEEFETAKRRYEQEMKINVARQRGIQLQEKNVKLGKEAAEKLGGTFKENKFVNFLADPGSFFKSFKANFNVFAAIGNGLNAVADGALSAMYSLLKKSFMAAIDLDNSIVGFRKNTQILDSSVEESIRSSYLELMKFGITSEEVAKSYEQLYQANTRFGDYSVEQKKQIADQISKYTKLGYSAENLVEQFTFLTNVYRMSDDAAINAQKATLKYGRSIGLTGQQTTKAVQATKNLSAALGDSTGRELGKMMKVMKETNLEMGTLVKLADKFDTFESAADTVGRLNSILGGPYLNAIQMIENVNPADRINSVRTALMEAGKSFESMEYYEKKSIASAIGLETEDLALLMAGRQDLIEGLDFTKTTEDIVDSREQMNKFIGVIDKLKSIAMSLIIPFGGVVDVIREMIDNFEKSGAIDDFAKKMKDLVGSDEFKETLKSVTASVLKIVEALPGLIKFVAGVVDFVVKHPWISGAIYLAVKGAGFGLQAFAMRSAITAATTAATTAASTILAGAGAVPPVPPVPPPPVPVAGAAAGAGAAAAGAAMAGGAIAGGALALGGLAYLKGTSMGTEGKRAMLGLKAIGNSLGMVSDEDYQKARIESTLSAKQDQKLSDRIKDKEIELERAKSGAKETGKSTEMSSPQTFNINLSLDQGVFAQAVINVPAGNYPSSQMTKTLNANLTKGAMAQ